LLIILTGWAPIYSSMLLLYSALPNHCKGIIIYREASGTFWTLEMQYLYSYQSSLLLQN